jgi:hypothetical protein
MPWIAPAPCGREGCGKKHTVGLPGHERPEPVGTWTYRCPTSGMARRVQVRSMPWKHVRDYPGSCLPLSPPLATVGAHSG